MITDGSVRSTCNICHRGCGVRIQMEGGKPVGIKGDPQSPVNEGKLCIKGQTALELLHHPDRLKYPLKRVGPKGSYDFERISWDEAYRVIVGNLNRIKKESGAEAVAIYTGRGAQELSLCDMFQPKGVTVSSASNVLFPFGSPNTMGVGALCYVSVHMIAPLATMGRMQTNLFNNIENAEMVVVWGTNPATDSPPIDMLRLEEAARRGADIVVIDPRRTETAVRSNAQWVPIRPGTDGALALSLIEVLIEDDLYSLDFAEIECTQREARWNDAATILVKAGTALKQGGADFLVICTNTMHKIADIVAERTSLPILHIGDAVGSAVTERGLYKVGLLGTRFVM